MKAKVNLLSITKFCISSSFSKYIIFDPPRWPWMMHLPRIGPKRRMTSPKSSNYCQHYHHHHRHPYQERQGHLPAEGGLGAEGRGGEGGEEGEAQEG